MAKINFPYRRLADQFYKVARSKETTPEAWRRVGSLIDRNFEEIDTGGGIGEVIIDFGDVIYVGSSKGFWAKEGLTLKNIVAHVVVPPTSAVDFDILINGLTVGSGTLPAGDRSVELADLAIAMVAGDIWQMRITDAGTGGAGIVFQGTFD